MPFERDAGYNGPMSLIPLLLLAAPNLAFRRAARQALAREMHDQASSIWDTTKSQQADLRKERPRHSFGVNRALRFFEWSCALYRALRQAGVTEADAGRLVQEINWAMFGPAFELGFSVSRWRGKHPRVRVKWVVDMLFRFLFTAPFERTHVPSDHDVAFNVTVCPLAQYFNDRGVPELTRHAACGLDYRMAAAWGVGFERAQTIADGHPLCDFRFKIESKRDATAASA